jgi:hypothetical protein
MARHPIMHTHAPSPAAQSHVRPVEPVKALPGDNAHSVVQHGLPQRPVGFVTHELMGKWRHRVQESERRDASPADEDPVNWTTSDVKTLLDSIQHLHDLFSATHAVEPGECLMKNDPR